MVPVVPQHPVPFRDLARSARQAVLAALIAVGATMSGTVALPACRRAYRHAGPDERTLR